MNLLKTESLPNLRFGSLPFTRPRAATVFNRFISSFLPSFLHHSEHACPLGRRPNGQDFHKKRPLGRRPNGHLSQKKSRHACRPPLNLSV